jgi:hypothetical protein
MAAKGVAKDMTQAETVAVRIAHVRLGISRNALYRGVQSGDVPSIKIGNRILIPRRWLDSKLSGK